jgi:NAD(P)-dependent dehydrogenase (short-subunit alcohol dehydrogenase family)
MAILSGQHALVTGAGRGIGEGCALALAEAGATVVAVSRTGDELDALVKRIEAIGGQAIAVVADVRDPEAVAAAVDPDAIGGVVTVCVHAAGVNRPQPAVDIDIDTWEQIIGINLRGTFVVCQAVGRQLLSHGQPGTIVTLSSQMGAVGYPGRTAYCASKHGVNGLTKALAVEWAPDGIRVNAVAPTFIKTPFTEPFFAEPGFREEVLARIPMATIGEVDDVVGAVMYLVSPAARLVTGHVLTVDGGWTAW